nr:hypothetical protein [Tanacetum cinerariifolium]
IMDTTKAQQIALEYALVAPANRLKIGKCNHQLSSDLKSNEPTFQVATVSTHHHLLRFKMNDKSHTLNVKNFRDMLLICPRLSGVYGVILPDDLTNQEMLDSKAYKEYYAIASRAIPPKAKTKYKKKIDEPVTSPKSKTASASKDSRLKSKAKVTKPDMKKQPAKKTNAKGLVILSEVALSEAEQIKLATKRSKKYFHISHVSGSGDGVDTQSKVPDDDKESWGDSEDEDDNDDEGDNEEEGDNDDDVAKSDDQDDDNQTKYEDKDVDEGVCTPFGIEFTDEEKLDDEEIMNDEKDDEVLKELGSKQQNVSQESGFEQEEEDAHVTLTLFPDTQKADEPVQSSSISSKFTSMFLNLKNPSLVDNEIASLMEL